LIVLTFPLFNNITPSKSNENVITKDTYETDFNTSEFGKILVI